MFTGGFKWLHAALYLYLTRPSCLCCNMRFYIKAGHLLVRWDVPEHSHKPCDVAGQSALLRVWILSGQH